MFHNKLVTEITSVDIALRFVALGSHDYWRSPHTHQSAVWIELVGEQALTLALPTQELTWPTKSPFFITEDLRKISFWLSLFLW